MKIKWVKAKITNKDGATSVLVIFMLMVLATLGAFAITSANANYKLSQRALEWNNMYYGLDAKGEEFISALDGVLAGAQLAFLDDAEKNVNISKLTDDNKDVLYKKHVSSGLPALSLAYPNFEVYVPENGDPINIHGVIRSDYPGMENCCLKISVIVKPISLTADLSESGLRYRITEWSEFQETAVKEESNGGLWDGKIQF